MRRGNASCCLIAVTAAVLAASTCRAQELAGTLAVNEGRDAGWGISYVRITLRGQGPSKDAGATALPALTVECSEKSGKRRVDLYFDFGDADRSYHSPPERDPLTHFLPHNPDARLTLAFKDYKTLKLDWEVMPTHEYKYRVPGMRGSNLEEVRFILRDMYLVPALRVSYTDRKVNDAIAEFHTSGLIAEMNRTALCKP